MFLYLVLSLISGYYIGNDIPLLGISLSFLPSRWWKPSPSVWSLLSSTTSWFYKPCKSSNVSTNHVNSDRSHQFDYSGRLPWPNSLHFSKQVWLLWNGTFPLWCPHRSGHDGIYRHDIPLQSHHGSHFCYRRLSHIQRVHRLWHLHDQ